MTVVPFDFQPMTRVVFGSGTLERLGELVAELAGKKVLVVSDPGVAAAGHLERGIRSIENAGLSTVAFTAVQENPTTRHVDAALDVAKKHDVDFLVGLGGGSSLDTAKGVNFLYTNGGRMADYWGVGKATKPMLPTIAIPTTAGTGSEAQSFALIADDVTHRKMACGDKKAACRIAILDPEVTISQPPKVCAVSAIDAISHALETWVTTKRNPVSLAYSRAAWELLVEGVPKVFSSPADLDARGRVLLGAHFAGAAIENSMLGAAHAAANPLTARFKITHGAAVGLMLPHVLDFNAKVSGDDYRRLADVNHPDQTGVLKRPTASAIAFVLRMLDLAGLPTRLLDYGITEGNVAILAADASKEWTGTFNPRPIVAADFEQLYRDAL